MRLLELAGTSGLALTGQPNHQEQRRGRCHDTILQPGHAMTHTPRLARLAFTTDWIADVAARSPRSSGDDSNRRGGLAPRENTSAASWSDASDAVTGICNTLATSRAP